MTTVYPPAGSPQPFVTICSDEFKVQTISMPSQYVDDTVTISIPTVFQVGDTTGITVDLSQVTATLAISTAEGVTPTVRIALSAPLPAYFEITPAMTTQLGVRNWYLEMKFDNADGRIKTVASGYMTLIADTV